MDRIITVTGAGRVAVRPDIVRVDGSIEGRCATYAEAVTGSADSVAALKDAVAEAGFDRGIVRTTGFSVNTEYRRTDGGDRVFNGFGYAHGIRMEIPADGSVGRLLEALFGCERSPEFRVSYAVSDPTVPMAAARRAAVEDAASKAREIAGSAGVTLGDMVSISYVSSPCNFASAGRMLSSHGSDITPDDLDFNDSVTIQWEIA